MNSYISFDDALEKIKAQGEQERKTIEIAEAIANNDATDIIERLQVENERLKKKLDAAVRDMKQFSIDWFKRNTRFPCDWCRHQLKDGTCQWKIDNPQDYVCYAEEFKWRWED